MRLGAPAAQPQPRRSRCRRHPLQRWQRHKQPLTPRSRTPPLPCCRFSQSARGGWNDGPVGDKVRRQEQQVLNAWTSERGMQLAAGGTMALVLLLLFAAGGPPSDARCTLPWC